MTRRRSAMKALMPLGDVLSKNVFGKRGETLLTLYRLRRAWAGIVGESLAAKTWPKRIQKETLVVAAENPVWAAQLSMMKEEILKAVLLRTGQKYSDLRFVSEEMPAQRDAVRS